MFKTLNILIVLTLILNNQLNFTGAVDPLEIEQFLKSYDRNFNRNVFPNYGKPVDVNISMHMKHISSVSEVDMDFKLDFLLRHQWNDKRLGYIDTLGLTELILGAEFVKKIWIPDSFIVNSKKTSFHSSANLETNSFIRIKPNGDVLYSLRVTVVAVCQMYFQYFPMDTQICVIDIGSYAYTVEELEYHWVKPNGIEYQVEMNLPNYIIKCTHLKSRYTAQLATGNYSRLRHTLVFSRAMDYYINHVYIPSVLIVVISWIPFWLKRGDNLGRVGLGVTTVLTMTTLVTNTNEAMPKISYMKSLDIYLEVCFGMVVAALIQYALVGYFTSRCPESVQPEEVELRCSDGDKCRIIRHYTTRIDWHSRWIFPIAFSLFNLLYWSIYLALSQTSECDNT